MQPLIKLKDSVQCTVAGRHVYHDRDRLAQYAEIQIILETTPYIFKEEQKIN